MNFDELNKSDLGYNGLPSYMEGFEAGAQSRQEEVLKLQDEIDNLQKRIDKAVEHIEDYYGVVELSMIVDILEGK